MRWFGRARRRDQADIGLPRHERQRQCAYFRTRLRQRARHRSLYVGRRPAHLGQGRLEGHAGRAGLSARRTGVGLPAIHHRAGAGFQRLSLRSHPRRSDAPRVPAPDLSARRDVGARKSPPARSSAIPMRPVRANRSRPARSPSRRPGTRPQRSTRKTSSRTSSSLESMGLLSWPMVRDARRRAPHHEGSRTSCRGASRKRCVSKDEAVEVGIAPTWLAPAIPRGADLLSFAWFFRECLLGAQACP